MLNPVLKVGLRSEGRTTDFVRKADNIGLFRGPSAKKNPVSAIYIIVNLATLRTYVGSSSNVFSRICDHYYALKKRKHDNKALQRDFDDSGIQNFQFQILEVDIRKDRLIEREQFFLDLLREGKTPLYNYGGFAYSALKGGTITDKQRAALREARLGTPAWNKGKPWSDDAKQKMSNSHKRAVRCLETNEVFDSLESAAQKYRTFGTSIGASIRRNGKCRKLHWEFVEI